MFYHHRWSLLFYCNMKYTVSFASLVGLFCLCKHKVNTHYIISQWFKYDVMYNIFKPNILMSQVELIDKFDNPKKAANSQKSSIH